MKKILAAVATAAVLASPLAVTDAAHAKKRNPGCITKVEFRKIKKGQTPRKVARIVGGKGKVFQRYEAEGFKSEMREFKACKPFNKNSVVMVAFSSASGPVKAYTKTAEWARN